MLKTEKEIYERINTVASRLATFFLEESEGTSHTYYSKVDKSLKTLDTLKALDIEIKNLQKLYFALDRKRTESLNRLMNFLQEKYYKDSYICNIFTYKIVKILEDYLGESATLGDLIKHTASEIKSLKGIGSSRFGKIRDVVEASGLEFKKEGE